MRALSPTMAGFLAIIAGSNAMVHIISLLSKTVIIPIIPDRDAIFWWFCLSLCRYSSIIRVVGVHHPDSNGIWFFIFIMGALIASPIGLSFVGSTVTVIIIVIVIPGLDRWRVSGPCSRLIFFYLSYLLEEIGHPYIWLVHFVGYQRLVLLPQSIIEGIFGSVG